MRKLIVTGALLVLMCYVLLWKGWAEVANNKSNGAPVSRLTSTLKSNQILAMRDRLSTARGGSNIYSKGNACLSLYTNYQRRLHPSNNATIFNDCTKLDIIQGIDSQLSKNKDFQKIKNEFNEKIQTTGIKIIEGHSGAVKPQTHFYYYLANEPWVTTVCEIGFNAGHSALIWLGSNTKTTLKSFDLGGHKYTQPMADFFNHKFGKRFDIVIGDSTITIPQLINSSMEYHHSCDIVVVDGGHTYDVARTDLINMQKLARKERHILVFDDYPSCMGNFMTALGKAWNELVYEGFIEEIYGCFMPSKDHGFVFGNYKQAMVK